MPRLCQYRLLLSSTVKFLHPAVMCAKLCEIIIVGLAVEMLSL
jgi:hypothetical protein